MNTIEIIFWLLIGLTFYAYIGYGILIWIMVKIKRLFVKSKSYNPNFLPEVTLLIAAYNEEDCIEAKIENSLSLNYPKEKLKIAFVTDGSTDRTAEIISKNSAITLYHKDGRSGKMAAINRVMPLVSTPITIYSDANAMLNADAVREIVKHFEDEKVGVVAGEKRIMKTTGKTAEVGEGIYWKYEGFLKRLDSELYSTVGAAGELYAIRTSLFEELEADTLLDDFVLSLRICQKGYVTAYEPNAFATETASLNSSEELKRKIRICAGGFQSVVRMPKLLNPFKNGLLTFQYISHRVLRWVAVPFALILILGLNISLFEYNEIYKILLFGQILFYSMAILGFYFERAGKKVKVLYVPYYFSLMNYSALAGFKRFLNNQQKVVWEKAIRS
ncbi:glycosyl transferase family 2 [Emticicia oligotrophica DSM 17448]|uniref:Glycosyl transferase family 2 n=1 Tax=Emticicia oligotrophica (strain DSM 17448 / CIP 109782 / MTCC 6937 / GPTSA100-15) TaxID=929562 RepID=A0ABN4AR97_EMTOG|nr:glycosyltransferase family 2 protein [Emticicia oligotrophica]AFK04963.1 glycosyl transferase family 2 [Emticicia oligotrophica DSM 17448]